MSIRKLKDSALSSTTKSSKFWDQKSSVGNYESIATVSVGAGNATSIEFTAIPLTYKHLQVRGIVNQVSGSNSNGYMRVDVNGSQINTYRHLFMGNGSSASSYSDNAGGNFILVHLSSSNTNIFSGFILDVLDYANTKKTKTLKCWSGVGPGSYGQVQFSSTMVDTLVPFHSIKLVNTNGDFRQYSHVALYGIRG